MPWQQDLSYQMHITLDKFFGTKTVPADHDTYTSLTNGYLLLKDTCYVDGQVKSGSAYLLNTAPVEFCFCIFDILGNFIGDSATIQQNPKGGMWITTNFAVGPILQNNIKYVIGLYCNPITPLLCAGYFGGKFGKGKKDVASLSSNRAFPNCNANINSPQPAYSSNADLCVYLSFAGAVKP